MNFKKINLYIVMLIICISSPNMFSAEVDQFNYRNEQNDLTDSTELIDKLINEQLETTVNNSNGFLAFKCGGDNVSDNDKKEARTKLIENIKETFLNSSPIGTYEKWANKKLDKKHLFKIPLNNSIYADFEESSLPFKTGKGLTGTIKVNNQLIGTDKLGHFFNEGFKRHFAHVSQTAPDKYLSGIIDSKVEEKGIFGLETTKIFSYADISANLAGQKFWSSLCGTIDHENFDIRNEQKIKLKKNICHENDLIQCDLKTGNWILNNRKKFTFKDYVTPAWDEGINCSLYDDSVVNKIFNKLISNVDSSHKKNSLQPCPIDPKLCFEISKYYQQDYFGKKVSDAITSPICKKIIEAQLNKTVIDKNEKFNYSYSNYFNESGVAKRSTTPATGSPASTSTSKTKN